MVFDVDETMLRNGTDQAGSDLIVGSRDVKNGQPVRHSGMYCQRRWEERCFTRGQEDCKSC
jgi:hypothetical protein